MDQKIEAEIRKDLVSIKTFDKNKDGVLDDNEIKNAVSKAKSWGSNRDNTKEDWFYYGTDGQIGPINWRGIEEISIKFPKVFISRIEHESNTDQKAVNWLPAKIIFFAKRVLSA